jgi:DNA processing protein
VTSSNETAALVALLRTGHPRPPSIYADLVEERGSALAVLEIEHQRGANFARPTLFGDETMNTHLKAAATDLARWQQQGFKSLTVLDPDYPDNLRAVHDRPPLIFVAGSLKPHDAKAVAVIGARKASPPALEQAATIARHLVSTGYTVVSGLAAGIDTAAHTAALDAGGRTVAVIGTGLAHAYPPHNAPLQDRLATDHAVISQFWPETPPSRQTFPMRNATMSGLALATVVVEAGERSGARTQARLALNHGRPVFLAAALQKQTWARQLLATKAGVHVISDPPQIRETIERLTAPGALVP